MDGKFVDQPKIALAKSLRKNEYGTPTHQQEMRVSMTVSVRTDNAEAQARHRRGLKTELAEIKRDQRAIGHQIQDLRAELAAALASRTQETRNGD